MELCLGPAIAVVLTPDDLVEFNPEMPDLSWTAMSSVEASVHFRIVC